MSLVFLIDYVPLLSVKHKTAIILYDFYSKFKNDDNVVQIKYEDIKEHLGFAYTTINSCHNVLRELELIEEVDDDKPTKSYKISKIIPIHKVKRFEFCKQYDIEVNVDTQLRKRYLEDNIPTEYEKMLDKKNMKKCFKALGIEKFKMAKYQAKYFEVDFQSLKLLLERKGENSFCSKIRNICKEIAIENTKKKTSKFTDQDKKLANHLFKKLEDNGVKITDGRWKLKNYGSARRLLVNNKIPYEELINCIDWAFDDDFWCNKFTQLAMLDSIYPQYTLKKKKPGNGNGTKKTLKSSINRKSLLPAEIVQKVKEVEPNIPCKTYGDIYFIRSAVKSGAKKNKKLIALIADFENQGHFSSMGV